MQGSLPNYTTQSEPVENSQGGGIFVASRWSFPLILPLTMSLSQRFLFISCHFPSHSGSLLLSQLDKPDVPLIRHTNVISLLYNHPFSCFHALSPNLRPVSWITVHSNEPDDISFNFICFCVEATCCSAVDQHRWMKRPHTQSQPG